MISNCFFFFNSIAIGQFFRFLTQIGSVYSKVRMGWLIFSYASKPSQSQSFMIFLNPCITWITHAWLNVVSCKLLEHPCLSWVMRDELLPCMCYQKNACVKKLSGNSWPIHRLKKTLCWHFLDMQEVVRCDNEYRLVH